MDLKTRFGVLNTMEPNFTCTYCKQPAHKRQADLNYNERNGLNSFCSRKCSALHKQTRVYFNCPICNIEFYKIPHNVADTKNHFCSRRCAAIYNQAHKTHGCRRSKLEVYLETKLRELYPNLDFVFNGKTAINSELDIYIPSLKLAFELNGIFHYEPIYGEEKLAKIQNNDGRKYQACLEKSIELCIIDSSSFKHFKEAKAQEYLGIITPIIDLKWVEFGFHEQTPALPPAALYFSVPTQSGDEGT